MPANKIRSVFTRGHKRPRVVVETPDGRRLVTLVPSDFPGPTDEMHKTAALMAAAPALLEALRGVLDWYQHSDMAATMSKLGEQAEYHRTLRAAREAIKATWI